MSSQSGAVVAAVCSGGEHRFTKPVQQSIRLLKGLGVEGDAHLGVTVKHRSRVRKDPTQPNLRQVHLVHDELFDELRAAGFDLAPGLIGENITTHGIDLLGLPRDTKLHVGASAVIGVTGLRNPCRQLNDFRPGLMQATLDYDEAGNLIRKAGIMGVVLVDGDIHAGDPIRIELPSQPHEPLKEV